MERSPVNLTGVPETMLWTLHNRADEALRTNGFLRDPECVRIYQSIAYDYERSFGRPDGSHPMRSRMFDEVVRGWQAAHPGGTVVELGAGLETQFSRCDDGLVNWLCIDVSEAIAVRERFLPPTDRCRHVASSALDPAWMDEVDDSNGVFVTAQGLFMYFEEEDVRRLFTGIVERFAGIELMFDIIPRWFSHKTLKGFGKTKHYKAPPMPWGLGQDELEPLLRTWSPHIASVTTRSYGFSRLPLSLLVSLSTSVPFLRNAAPAIAHVRTQQADGRTLANGPVSRRSGMPRLNIG